MCPLLNNNALSKSNAINGCSIEVTPLSRFKRDASLLSEKAQAPPNNHHKPTTLKAKQIEPSRHGGGGASTRAVAVSSWLYTPSKIIVRNRFAGYLLQQRKQESIGEQPRDDTERNGMVEILGNIKDRRHEATAERHNAPTKRQEAPKTSRKAQAQTAKDNQKPGKSDGGNGRDLLPHKEQMRRWIWRAQVLLGHLLRVQSQLGSCKEFNLNSAVVKSSNPRPTS
ncbi:Hypothetical predicted protein [Prunus dulcis]|uniref:Uncharacterized protein n=1 Tax=Prunus dulcis TaxID=3755 RepID=A0A5E4EWR9_PRUDU|nr:hypothetical protein L3X38_043805 [Prunus dulcis]VVA18188.1 Hypothetical predicted protein [Prunus dulcis]